MAPPRPCPTRPLIFAASPLHTPPPPPQRHFAEVYIKRSDEVMTEKQIFMELPSFLRHKVGRAGEGGEGQVRSGSILNTWGQGCICPLILTPHQNTPQRNVPQHSTPCHTTTPLHITHHISTPHPAPHHRCSHSLSLLPSFPCAGLPFRWLRTSLWTWCARCTCWRAWRWSCKSWWHSNCGHRTW